MTAQEQEFLNRAIVIKEETDPDANSAVRVGSLLEDAYTYIFNLLNTVNTVTPVNYLTPYASNKQYAFDINNPFAVLYPDSFNKIRIWVLKPTVSAAAKLRNTPNYNSNSEWQDIGISTNIDTTTLVKYTDLVAYFDTNELNKAPSLKFFTDTVNELNQRITNASQIQVDGQSVLTAVEYFYIYNEPAEGDVVDPELKYINEVNRTVTLANPFYKIIDLIAQDVNGEAVKLGFNDEIPSTTVPIPLYNHSTATTPEYEVVLRPTADPTGSMTRVEVHYHYLAEVDEEGNETNSSGPAIPPYNNLELYQYGQEPKFVWYNVDGKDRIWTLKNTINTQQNETRTPPSYAENNQWTDTSITVSDASVTTKGIAKLSVPPVDADNPVAVADNDPRLAPASPTGVKFTTAPGTPVITNTQITETSSVVDNAGTSVNIPGQTLTYALAASGQKRIDAIVVKYTVPVAYERIAGIEVDENLTANTPAIPADRLFVRFLTVTDGTVGQISTSTTVVQTTGQSTTSVMSQKAVTDQLAALGAGIQILVNFPIGSDNEKSILVSSGMAGTYQSFTHNNTASRAYYKNGSPVTLPFTIATNDTLKIIITRTDTALAAYVRLNTL